ncbi:hypothetical protein ACLK15_21005 [Escherichia coli]
MPMFLGSMIAGPLGGWCIKHFDRWVDGKIKSGFEMLVNNFSGRHHRDDPRYSGIPGHWPDR